MVDADTSKVEQALSSGGLGCPDCAGVLRRWGWARVRTVRGAGGLRVWLRPRRSRCAECGRTHVLLPVFVLVRRADVAAVIGAALVLAAAGAGFRTVAAGLGVAQCTVRGWLRRFRARAEEWRAVFTRRVAALDPVLGPIVAYGSRVGDAVEVMGLAAAAWVRRFGPRPPWEFVSAVSGGALLSPIPAAGAAAAAAGEVQHELPLGLMVAPG